MINAEIDAETEVLKTLKEIPEVKESHMVYGVYDLIVRIEADTMEELKNVINLRIRRLENIRSTVTMIVI